MAKKRTKLDASSENAEPASRNASSAPPFKTSLRFEKDELHLLEAIAKLAKQHKRSTNNEILVAIEEWLARNAETPDKPHCSSQT